MPMIGIGLDVHGRSVTAVVVDEAGRPLAERVIGVGSDGLLAWAAALDAERRWAVEDGRRLTGWLEGRLRGVGEQVVRVPRKLRVPERRAGSTGGNSDPIDGARDRPRGARGAGPEQAATRGAGLPGAEAAGRPSRRSRRPAPPHAATAALASAPARPETYAVPPRMLSRGAHLERG